jgi:hypothetical protein
MLSSWKSALHPCGNYAQTGLLLIAAVCLVQVHPLVLRKHDYRANEGSVSCSKLTNRQTHYTVGVGVGTPPQSFDLVADTGSNAVIVQSCLCQQLSEECKPWEKCFTGAGKSSTFVPPKKNSRVVLLRFGSGDVVAAIATDVVNVGQVSAKLEKGLMLMVKRKLPGVGDLEGIIGLGLPSWAKPAVAPVVALHANVSGTALSQRPEEPEEFEPPRFLEEAKVNMFSICFKPGQDGALRLDPPEMPNMMKQIGRRHWSLSLQGLTAGSSSAPVQVCNPSEGPCAGIPDSGTTHIMGPKDGIRQVLEELCMQWPRCKKFQAEQGFSSKQAFKSLLWDCGSWMTPSEGVGEVPSLFLHLVDADGEKNILEITPMSYVYGTTSVTGQYACAPSLGVWTYKTKNNGPAWILGTSISRTSRL